MLDTRLLRTFMAVTAAGTYSEAARRLGYTQPAVSQHIRALEKSVATPLFIRVGRHMQLTDAGELLARHGTRILGDLDAAQQQVATLSHLASGRVRLCTFPSAGATIVAAAAAQLRTSGPGVRLQLTESEPPDSLALLRAGRCDITLGFNYDGPPDADTSDLVVTPLLDDDMQVVLPADHPLHRSRTVDLADLSAQTWIAGCPRCRATFVSACAQAGFDPDIAVATDDSLAVQSLVVAGLGIGVLPSLVLSFLRHPRLVMRPLRPAVRRSVAAYTLPDYAKLPAVRATIDALKAQSRRLVQSDAPTDRSEPRDR